MALLRYLPSSSLTHQPSYNLSDALFVCNTSDCKCWLHRIEPTSSFGERVTCAFLLDFLVHPPHYCCTTMGSYATCSNSSTLSIDFLLTVCTIFYSSTGVLMAGTCRRGPPSWLFCTNAGHESQLSTTTMVPPWRSPIQALVSPLHFEINSPDSSLAIDLQATPKLFSSRPYKVGCHFVSCCAVMLPNCLILTFMHPCLLTILPHLHLVIFDLCIDTVHCINYSISRYALPGCCIIHCFLVCDAH